MLKTNGPRPLEKIHGLLKSVYKTDIPYNYTENQTKEILRKMLAVSISSYSEAYYLETNYFFQRGSLLHKNLDITLQTSNLLLFQHLL